MNRVKVLNGYAQTIKMFIQNLKPVTAHNDFYCIFVSPPRVSRFIYLLKLCLTLFNHRQAKQRTTFDYIIHKEETNNVFQIIHKLSNGMKVVIEKVSPEQNAYATVKQPQNASVNYVDVCIVYLQNVRTLKLQLFFSSFTGGAILLRSTSSCLWSIY